MKSRFSHLILRHFLTGFLVLAVWTPGLGFAIQILCEQTLLGKGAVSESVENNKFVTGRDLYDYEDSLPKGFKESLGRLKSDQHIVDLGAGKMKMLIQYLGSFRQLEKAPRATAVIYKSDRWFAPPKFRGKLQVHGGAFELQNTEDWPQADLMTDLYGVMSYSLDLQTSLEKIFSLLKVGGELYVYTPSYRTQFRFQEGEKILTKNYIDFLRGIQGLEVEGFYNEIKITKRQDLVTVPKIKLLEMREDGKDIPIRVYQVHP